LNYQFSGLIPNAFFAASFTLPEHSTPSKVLLSRSELYFAPLPVNDCGKWTTLTVVFSSLLGGGVLGTDGFALLGQLLFL
jgi:hypothetical protein